MGYLVQLFDPRPASKTIRSFLQVFIIQLLFTIRLAKVHLGNSLTHNLHALLQAICKRTLPRHGILRKRSRTTKRTGRGAIPDAYNAHVRGAADGAVARHTRRHLDLQGEIRLGREREPAHAQAGNILDDVGILEGVGVGAARRAVDGGRQGSRAVLVDLAVDEAHDAVVVGGRETLGAALARGVGDHALRAGAGLVAVAAAAGETAEKTAEAAAAATACSATLFITTAEKTTEQLIELALAVLVALVAGGGSTGEVGEVVFLADGARGAIVCRGGLAAAHEASNVDGCIDGTGALGLAERVLAEVAVADDGRVGLRATAIGGAITRCPVSDFCLPVLVGAR